MSYLKFNHVFFGLMLLSVLGGFVFSPRITNRARAQVRSVFVPVAWPVARISGWAHARLSPRPARDDGSPAAPRSEAEIRLENDRLRVQLANLEGQLSRLQEREMNREQVGEVRKLCTPFSVAGGDSAGRDSLMLGGTSFAGLRPGMPVLYAGGIAGRIGAGGSQVILVTDPSSKLVAAFAQMVRSGGEAPKPVRLKADPVLVEGIGNGAMRARMTTRAVEAAGLKPEDWVVLSDRDGWPLQLENYRVGLVESIQPGRDPGFVEVIVRPGQDLSMLREVMVMNK